MATARALRCYFSGRSEEIKGYGKGQRGTAKKKPAVRDRDSLPPVGGIDLNRVVAKEIVKQAGISREEWDRIECFWFTANAAGVSDADIILPL